MRGAWGGTGSRGGYQRRSSKPSGSAAPLTCACGGTFRSYLDDSSRFVVKRLRCDACGGAPPRENPRMTPNQIAARMTPHQRATADSVAWTVSDNIVSTMREAPRGELLESWPTKRAAVLAHEDTARELYEAKGETWNRNVWRYIVDLVLDTYLSLTDWPRRRR